MESERKAISPLLYLILISSLTNIFFLLVGIAILTTISLNLSNPVVRILIFFLLWKGVLVGVVTGISYKKSYKKEYLVKFIGMYLGRFFGLFIGGFVGATISKALKQEDIIGFLVGAIIFYLSGRWIGSNISSYIGTQLDKVFFITGIEPIVIEKPLKRSSFIVIIIFGIIFPWSLVAIGLLINYYAGPIDVLSKFLPISRIIAIVLSALLLIFPWFMKNHWLVKDQSIATSPELIMFWQGVIFAISPTMYGLILYLVMGASVLELCIFAAISSSAAFIWSINNKKLINQRAG